jgi:GDPmannose 4,6-dehydratase
VRDFLGFAFGHAGLEWEKYVDFDQAFLRPAEVDVLVGDSSHAKSVTGWTPKVMTPELARIMVDADVKIVESAGSQWIDRPVHG